MVDLGKKMLGGGGVVGKYDWKEERKDRIG